MEMIQVLVMRWQRHSEIVAKLETTNLDSETLWKKQIEMTFIGV